MDSPLVETPEIICPAPDATSFTVGGVTYAMSNTLTVARARIMQRFELEFGADTSFRGLAAEIDAIWALKNASKDADATHAFGSLRDHFTLDGPNVVGLNRLRGVEICGLFFLAPGEDPGVYDFAQQQKKCYTDWAGVAEPFFFLRAVGLVASWRQSYSSFDQPDGPTPPSEPLPSA